MADDKVVIFKLKQFPVTSETFIVNAIVATINEGYEVKIITENVRAITESSQQDLIAKYDLMSKVIPLTQPTHKKTRLKEALKMFLSPKRFFFFLRLMVLQKQLSLDYVFWLKHFKLLQKSRVFHVHFATALKPLVALKKIGYIKTPIILTFHGYDAHYLPEGNQLKKIQKDIKKYIYRITTNSTYLKNILVDKGFENDQIDVVPIGIHRDLFHRKKDQNLPPHSPFKLMTVGRLIPLKGQHYGIQIVKNLIDRDVEVQYTIVGDGEQMIVLEKLISELKLEQYVHFVGTKTQAEIIDMLHEHHVYLMTSTYDKDHRREAFGLVSVEAQAIGLPVIGFDSGGFPETILEEKTGCLIKDRDIMAAVMTIETFVKDRKLLETYSQNAQEYAHSNFDIATINRKYTTHY